MFDRLVDLFVQFLHLFRFFTAIRAYEGGVVLRFGKFHRVVEPGFRWMWPFRIEEVLVASVALETIRLDPQSLTSKDGVSVVIAVVVTYSVSDVHAYLIRVWNAQNVIEDSALGIVARVVESSTWEQLVKPDFSEDLARQTRRAARKWGVDVSNVQVVDLTRSRSIRLIQHWNANHGSAA